MSIRAALFDFDGVLFDTERHHELCWRRVAADLGKPISREQFLEGFGVKNKRFICDILRWTDQDAEAEAISRVKEAYFQDYLRSVVVDPIPGTLDLIDRLSHEKIPLVICSSSIRSNIDQILAPHPALKSRFDRIISSENVSQGKPDPEIFLLGASSASAAPSESVVFEDAPLGLRAAKRGGLIAIGLTTTFSSERLQEESPDYIASDLGAITMEDLFRIGSKSRRP